MDTVAKLLKELSTFPDREEKLRREFRWRNRRPMFYRPNLWTHSKHVAWLVADVASVVRSIFPTFDERRSIAIALVHDDPEIVTGDYTAGDKAIMKPEQLKAIADEEQDAIRTLINKFPKMLGGYDYEELLQDVIKLDTLEANIAKYTDRIDGFGEGLHEVYAGNPNFIDVLMTPAGVTPAFDAQNVLLRTNMVREFPALAKLKEHHVFFDFNPYPNAKEVFKGRSPHTKKSISQKVGYPEYDMWKKVILNSGDSEEIKNLYTQREFL